MRLFLMALVCMPLSANADEVAKEYKVKAAFIYNFTKFVIWPQQDLDYDAESFNVCILGDNRLTAAASTIQGKLVQGKVLQIKSIANIGEFGQCEIIFLAVSNSERQQQILESIKDVSVLSVGDSSSFVDNGGIIGLFVENNGSSLNRVGSSHRFTPSG